LRWYNFKKAQEDRYDANIAVCGALGRLKISITTYATISFTSSPIYLTPMIPNYYAEIIKAEAVAAIGRKKHITTMYVQ